jgi:tetratricopeptide (TPR) repeat protein
MRPVACILAAVLAAGCAPKAKPVAPQTLDLRIDLAPADALFDAGCYSCLKQAFELYDRSLHSLAPPAEARGKAFDTAVLLAAREKELGLAATPWLDRAASLANTDERIYVDIVSSLAWTTAGTATDFEPPRPAAAARSAWQSFLDQAPADGTPATPGQRRHPILDQYLRVATACADNGRRAGPELEKRIDLGRPTLRYRIGLCGVAQRPHLEAVLAADPRFAEAAFFIGRYEMATGVVPQGGGRPNRIWLSTSVPPLLTAHEGIPEAPVITTVLAGLMRSRTELGRALALYDDALKLRPTQRDALLGRVITLTYLARRDEAIATATNMIELGTWYIGSAYYWRALNRYHKTELDLAAADVATARKLLLNDDLLTLAGLIAYDQHRPKDARADFGAAIEINQERCIAHWYLGILDLDESAWTAAVPRFSTAGGCFQRAAESLRDEEKQLPADLPEDTRREQLAGFADSIENSLRQAGRSFLNASQASLRIGDKANALNYARTASVYDEVKERADTLVRSLSGQPKP